MSALLLSLVLSAPNILLVVADDLGIEHMQSYGIGSTYPQTPTIDSLAASGLRFTHAWSNPLCSPSRVTIQTGRYGVHTRVGDNVVYPNGDVHRGMQLSETILPELLTGYATGAFGKWHMGADATLGGRSAPNLAGYSHYSGGLASDNTTPGGLPEDLYFNSNKTVDGVLTTGVTKYATEDTTDDAVAWINAQAEPWFAYVAYLAPHLPFHWPPAEMHHQDTQDQREIIQYRAMIEALDYQLDRLLTQIDTSNTIVIFVSDNGSAHQVAQPPVLPDKAKGTLYEGGIRVPLIITGPGVATAVVDAPVNLADLYATVAEVAQVPAPPSDSISLVPYFSNPDAVLRAFAYSEYWGPNGGPVAWGDHVARDARYLFKRGLSGQSEMYDLRRDPWEEKNMLARHLTPAERQERNALVDYLDSLYTLH